MEILQSARHRQNPFSVTLACGFTPLHVGSFLVPNLQGALPDRRVEIKTGLYGDLAGTLERASGSDAIRAVVDQAFSRPDLLLPKESVFPIEAHWEAKSKSVGRILKAWNIAADSVVLVDDSPMELAEVKTAWPEMECLEFSGKDPASVEKLLRTLRDLFGKNHLGEEDSLRLESLRRAAEFHGEAGQSGGDPEQFLAQAEAAVTIEFNPAPGDARVLELVNKTNQFNLNGRRHTEADWRRRLEQAGAFAIAVSYQDKFGPLGKIAALSGRHEEGIAHLSAWVMRCRAFSGRGVYKSLDGGARWRSLNQGLTNLDVRLLAVASNAPYAVTSSGIFQSHR